MGMGINAQVDVNLIKDGMDSRGSGDALHQKGADGFLDSVCQGMFLELG